jgi:hypothetical protein
MEARKARSMEAESNGENVEKGEDCHAGVI